MSEMIAFNKDNPEYMRLQALPTEELMALMARSLTVTVESLCIAARCYLILYERGHDFSNVRLPLLQQIKKIAHGQALPEVVHTFLGRMDIIKRVSALPLPDQKRLAADPHVAVAVLNPNGTTTHRMRHLMDLRGPEVSLLFDGEDIRTVDRQVVILEQKNREALKADMAEVGPHRVDQALGIYAHGKYLVTWEEIDKAKRLRKRLKGA